MPLLKNPETLQDVCVEWLANYLYIEGNRHLNKICMSKSSDEQDVNFITVLKELITTNIPNNVFQHKLQPVFLKSVNKIAIGTSCLGIISKRMPNSDILAVVHHKCREFLCRLVDLCVPNYIEELSTAYLNSFVREYIEQDLNKFNKIHSLTLVSVQEDYILDALKQMVNLRHLVILGTCPTSVFSILHISCKKLISIEISKLEINDINAIQGLYKLSNLRKFAVYDGCFDAKSLAGLLINLPNLEMCHQNFLTGEGLAEMCYEGTIIRPNLHQVKVSDLTTKHMENLVKVFPNLKGLFLKSPEGDVTRLHQLNYLNKLIVHDFYFSSCKFPDLLQVKGSALQEITFSDVDNINVEILSEFCAVKQLTFMNKCTFIPLSPGHKLSKHFILFKTLTDLNYRIYSECCFLEYLLVNSHNLVSMTISSIPVDNEWFLNILNKNELVYLEKLHIFYSPNMNLNTVRLVLQKCLNLTQIGNLQSWRGIKRDSYYGFIKEVQKNNWYLNLLF